MRRIDDKAEALRTLASRRTAESTSEVRERVEAILEQVRSGGDRALRELTQQLDGADLERFELARAGWAAAEGRIPDSLKRSIRTAIARVRAYYGRQPAEGFLHAGHEGLIGQIVRPLDSVGCYVPGGTAPLFSTLIMLAVPAQVAGVRRIVAATPPRPDGTVAPEIVFVAHELGIAELYRLGGAQAIAALAYGTESVPAVDKVVGPGNEYVVAAKRALFGRVGVEALPGPTETLVVADASADPAHVAADLLAQAEHRGAQPILVTTHPPLADAIGGMLASAAATLPTAREARSSLAERGWVVVVETVEDALEIANAYAPEHLCLLVEDPWRAVPLVRNAGGVFVGSRSLEALGDYVAGPSHVMPTGGSARYASFVNVRDFQKVMPVLDLTASAVAAIGPAGAEMARAEGLEAHARAIESRLEP